MQLGSVIRSLATVPLTSLQAAGTPTPKPPHHHHKHRDRLPYTGGNENAEIGAFIADRNLGPDDLLFCQAHRDLPVRPIPDVLPDPATLGYPLVYANRWLQIFEIPDATRALD